MTDSIHVVTDKDHSAAFLPGYILHFLQTLFLKFGIAHGQHFIDQKDFRIEMGSDGKSESHVHSARVTFHRGVEKSFDFGEGDNLIELPLNFRSRHSEDRAVQENVFAAGQFRVKTGPDFEKGPNPTVNVHSTSSRLGNPI